MRPDIPNFLSQNTYKPKNISPPSAANPPPHPRDMVVSSPFPRPAATLVRCNQEKAKSTRKTSRDGPRQIRFVFFFILQVVVKILDLRLYQKNKLLTDEAKEKFRIFTTKRRKTACADAPETQSFESNNCSQNTSTVVESYSKVSRKLVES